MVSIIVLSYNKSTLTLQCLQSLFKNIDEKEIEVIVVDNASTDDSVTLIKKEFPKVKLIENTKNSGFAGGCNLGAKQARGEYLVFLNNDAEVTDNPLPQMIGVFKTNEHVGIVGGILENHNGTLQRSFGNFYSLSAVFRLLFQGESGELTKFTAKTVTQTDWVSGGFMMVKREVYEKVKGFDEAYFMYVEDMDLCYKVKKAGFSVYVQPESRVKHVGQASTNKTFAIVHIYEGLQIFYKQHKSKVEYFILRVLLLGKALVSLLIGLVTFNRYLLRTYTQALKTL